MAGIVVPTLFLLVILSVFATFRFSGAPPHMLGDGLLVGSLAGAIVFPMAVVPNLWGVWNMLHLALRSRARLPLGVHGAILPLLLVPAGVVLARTLGVFTIQWRLALAAAPIGMAVYYLVWKYVVGFLNDEIGVG
jgi:hypothetical protein